MQSRDGVGKPCHYCKRIMLPNSSEKVDPIRSGQECSVDHIIPKALGGTDHKDNLIFACRRCNSIRGHINYDIFYMFANMILRNHPDAPTIYVRDALVTFITSLAESAINNKRESKRAVGIALSKFVKNVNNSK